MGIPKGIIPFGRRRQTCGNNAYHPPPTTYRLSLRRNASATILASGTRRAREAKA